MEKSYINKIITLDHRRVPLPRTKEIDILSIKASDFPADKGVLPSKTELREWPICVVTIPKSKHNDIADFGPLWLQDAIVNILKQHLSEVPCQQLQTQVQP